MRTIKLKDAKACLSNLVDSARRGEFVTMTRDGKPVAAPVSVEATEIAHKTMEQTRGGLGAYLRTFPGGEFARNRTPSRDIVD
jgi:prevent-host-death family protein